MPFHQVLVAASPGDAISNAAFEIRDLLRAAGPSEIFARYIHPELTSEVYPLTEYERRTTGRSAHEDILLFHASIGEPAVFSFLEARPERIALIYHNISPPEPFRPYDPAFAGLLEGGRRELAKLAKRCVLAMAVSEFNAHELVELGYEHVVVTRLIMDVDRLRRTPSDGRFWDWIDGLDGPAFLFVGQLLPHKRPDLLLRAFHVLSTYLMPEAHLIIAGAQPLEAYATRIESYRQELNLTRAHMVGRLSAGQHAAAFRGASVFVTASEHEGFCVPLIEAMAVDLPVIARACGAIPETLGDAGLMLPADSTTLCIAEAMLELASNSLLRTEFVKRGRARVASFDPEAARRDFLTCLLEVV